MISRHPLYILLLLFCGNAAAQPEADTGRMESPAGRDEETASPTAKQNSVTFDVWEFRVKGNSMLQQKLVERAVYPYLGPDRSIQDVEAARTALERLYKDQGFPTIIVNVPQQDVGDGIVRLEVVQGSVDRLRISGSTYFSLGEIRKQVPALAEGEVPNLPRVQEELQALNQENPDRRITPVFRPGRRPGTVEVELRVKDKLPLHGSLELNGRNSADTSRTRLTGSLRYDNLWQRMHSLSLQYQTAPQEPDEVSVLSGTYVLPVGSGRDRLALYAINSESDTDIGGTGALSVIGNGTIAGARWVRPLEGTRTYTHSLTLGADYKDFEEAIALIGADSLLTPITYHKFSAQYRGSLFGDDRLMSFSAGVDFAFRGLGNSETEFENKRFQARPNFAYFTADLKREQQFDNGFRVRGHIRGQFAGQPLISNEQFSAGGADTVRGYFESERLGDDGLNVTFELYSPSFAGQVHDQVNEFRVLTFLDAAYLRLHDQLPGTAEDEELYSAGVGLRLRALDELDVGLDLAWPLTDGDDTEQGNSRFHFSLNYGF